MLSCIYWIIKWLMPPLTHPSYLSPPPYIYQSKGIYTGTTSAEPDFFTDHTGFRDI